jgi:serine/threonine protein kinase/Tol biopolymer transport system component
MIGQLVGHYRVLEKIGAGGMGEVFRARDERLGRDVALKLIRPASSNNPDHLRRFEQEARAAAALNHPNILAIFDVGFEGTAPYIVSELLAGKTIRQRLSEGPIPVREAVEYAIQIAHGLVAAHNMHIVHRDLKPENLFLLDDGRVKILDFGVAKLQVPLQEQRSIENLTTVTKHGAMIGTVAYMSPEQLRGHAVDHRSDIFTFGAIFYEMLTASRAFRGQTEVDTITAVLREEPAAIHLEQAAIPPGYQDIIKHCLEKEPDNRFQSAKDLAFALQTLSGSSPGRQIVLPPAPVKTPGWATWALATLLAIVTAALLMLLLRAPLPPPSYQRLTYEAGTIYSARFAPEGKSIVFTAAWNNKPSKLFMMLGDSLLPQPLELTNATLLAISGRSQLAVALGGTHNGQLETVNGMLADAPMAGGSPHQILSDVRWADWDGKGRMAVVHDADGQSRLEYPIGNVLYQTGGWISDIRFSPQFDQIAFMDHPTTWDNKGNLSLVDLNKKVRVLTPEWESEHGLAWRPDGKEIWFSAVEKGNNLNLMAVDLSGNLRPLIVLPDGITLQDISSDGRVLFTKDAKRLAMAFGVVGDTGDSEQSWHDWNVAKDIAVDGAFILFEDSSEAAGKNYAVVLRKPDGSPPIRLAEGSAGGLSPDGKWAISLSPDNPPQLTLLPTGPGQARSIPASGLDHINSAWARFLENGKQIMVNASQRGRAGRCYALDLAGADPSPVTPEGIRCGPSSPDSRFLIGTDANHRVAIYSLGGGTSDGGTSRSIPGLDTDFEPTQWSKDGSSLYGYRRGEIPSKVYKVEIATGKQSVVKELHPGAPAGVVSVAPVVVSRDGARFVYSYNQTLSTLYLVAGVH